MDRLQTVQGYKCVLRGNHQIDVRPEIRVHNIDEHYLGLACFQGR